MSRRNSRDGGKGGEEFLVECEKCKQWISGDSLGLDRVKVKKISFVCRACVGRKVGERSWGVEEEGNGIGKKGRRGEGTGNRSMEEGYGEKDGRVGEKSAEVRREGGKRGKEG